MNVEVGQRVWVISSPDEDCDRDLIWGYGVVTFVGDRTEVKFDNGSGGMFPNECMYPEVQKGKPVSWKAVSGYLRTNGWELTYEPVDGLSAYHWRSPKGISGSAFRSAHPDSPPEAVMLEALRDGLIWFTELTTN